MDADNLSMKGHSCLLNGNWKEAINYFSRAIEIYSPDDPVLLEEIYEGRGEAKSMMGDYLGAIADFDFTINRTCNSESAYFALYALFERGISKANLQDENGAWGDVKSYIEKRLKYILTKQNGGKAGWNADYASKVIESERQMLTRYLKNDKALVRLVIVKALELFGPHAMKSIRALKIAKKIERDERVKESLIGLIGMLERYGISLIARSPGSILL